MLDAHELLREEPGAGRAHARGDRRVRQRARDRSAEAGNAPGAGPHLRARARPAALARAHAELAVRRDPAAGNEMLAELMMDAGGPTKRPRSRARSIEADPSRYMQPLSHRRRGAAGRTMRRGDSAFRPRSSEAVGAGGRRPQPPRRPWPTAWRAPARPPKRSASSGRARRGSLRHRRARGAGDAVSLAGPRRRGARRARGIVPRLPQPTADTYGTVVHGFTVLGDGAGAREWAAKAHTGFPADPRFR